MAAFACLAALALTTCGTGERADDAAAASERFHAALQAGDGAAACDELSEETASKLEQREKKPCEEAILGLELAKGGTVEDTRVEITSAIATLGEGSSDFLDEGPGGWKLSAAGCTPTLPGRPYDCELEG